MLLNLHSGRVEGYNEGQEPLIYIVTSIRRVAAAGRPWVFSDGHGLAALTNWYDDPECLDEVDWDLVSERYWSDTTDDNDRRRRKQAEFRAWDGSARSRRPHPELAFFSRDSATRCRASLAVRSSGRAGTAG